MATKATPKNKKLVKVRDISPRKDAKGGKNSRIKGNTRGWVNHNETFLVD